MSFIYIHYIDKAPKEMFDSGCNITCVAVTFR